MPVLPGQRAFLRFMEIGDVTLNLT
jgi:hypothetical protein